RRILISHRHNRLGAATASSLYAIGVSRVEQISTRRKERHKLHGFIRLHIEDAANASVAELNGLIHHLGYRPRSGPEGVCHVGLSGRQLQTDPERDVLSALARRADQPHSRAEADVAYAGAVEDSIGVTPIFALGEHYRHARRKRDARRQRIADRHVEEMDFVDDGRPQFLPLLLLDRADEVAASTQPPRGPWPHASSFPRAPAIAPPALTRPTPST